MATCAQCNFTMTPARWFIVVGVVLFFIVAKVWVFHHPKGTIAIVIAAILLIFSESANAE